VLRIRPAKASQNKIGYAPAESGLYGV
jgi:hypothetical protein